MRILEVEKILRSEGVALGGYSGNYEFWNMKERNNKKNKGYWKGYASNLTQVLNQYKDFTDGQIHLYSQKMQDLISIVDIP